MTKTDLEAELLEYFYWFHAHPELSYEENQTTDKIREFLHAAGIEILPCALETGVVAIIRGSKEGAVQMLRCDIDALPITEQTTLSYRSQAEGKMHACGHDFHIVTGLATALLLQENRDKLQGNVKIIFQPGEETSLGALKVLETDIMEDVDFAWGFHADPTNEEGVLGIREGYVTAAVDRFVITVKGIGCHGAHPDDGVDSILAASAIVQALQSIVSRNVNAFHPSLLSVTSIHAGTTWNVIPPEAVMEGTVRTMEREDRILYERKVKEIAEKTAQAYGAEAVVTWIAGPPATYNEKEMAKHCEDKAKELGLRVVPEESSMGGDDFAFYEEETAVGRKIPGCYIKVGTGVGHPIHHPEFAINPEVILPTANYLCSLLLDA